MKLDKGTLMTIAGVYAAGAAIALLYIQPWSIRWDDKTLAWEYVILWPYAIYKLGTK